MLHVSNSSSAGAKTRFGIILSKILDYTRMSRACYTIPIFPHNMLIAIQDLLPAVQEFLRKYVHVWDGKLHRELILGLLSFVPLIAYDGMSSPVLLVHQAYSPTELSSAYLEPVEYLFLSNDEAAGASLLQLYTEMLRNWTVLYADRSPDDEPLDQETMTLRKLVKHVGHICLRLQHASNPPSRSRWRRLTLNSQALSSSAILVDSILSFYECASSLPWENSLFYIELPPDSLVYQFVFMGDAMVLSRICGVLSRFVLPPSLPHRQLKRVAACPPAA